MEPTAPAISGSDSGSGSDSVAPASNVVDKREQRDKVFLVIFASLSTFLYAGGAFGWGPMQLLLEANGNFANLCDEYENENEYNDGGPSIICPEQTEAFLGCRFWAVLTFLTGTLWGALSDRYGKRVLLYNFGGSTVAGLVLLMVAVRHPARSFQGPFLYASSVLIALGALTGGMLTVETGVLFRNNNDDDAREKNRVIALLNALFDAGALTYLGLWGLEKIVSSSPSSSSSSSSDVVVAMATPNANLLWILGGYLCLALISIGGYAYFFQRMATRNNSRAADEERRCSVDDDDDARGGEDDKKQPTNHYLPPGSERFPADATDNAVIADCDLDDPPTGRETTTESPSQTTTESDDLSYIPIAQRPPNKQLGSSAYLLLAAFYSFHTISNLWTLTAARDFLGSLGDDEYGNRYLGIFTLTTPISLAALPFLDVVTNRFGFHAALQSVNALAIVHGMLRVTSTNLNVQILGFVVYSFFRCCLYAAGLSCLADFVGLGAIGRATGTLFVLAGVASLFNIGMTHLAIDVFGGNFFVPDLIFLLLNIPVIGLTWWLGGALGRDQRARRRGNEGGGGGDQDDDD